MPRLKCMDRELRLTFCTNVLPGTSVEEIQANLERVGLPVREAVGGEAAFGLGRALGVDPIEVQNDLATVVPHPDTDVDWLRMTLGGILNRARWAEDPDLSAWLADSRLDPFSGGSVDVSEIGPEVLESMATLAGHAPAAVEYLSRLIAEAGAVAD